VFDEDSNIIFAAYNEIILDIHTFF